MKNLHYTWKELYCKGCPLINSYCVFKMSKYMKVCPCIDCLIKVLCNKVGCLKRNEVYEEYQLESIIMGRINDENESETDTM